jgi:pimeloyl-ACP methyl ester carboxylesterase
MDKSYTKGSVTSKDGTTIVFDKSGKGPAVILVGGAFQHRAIDQNTAQLAAILAPYFTVFHYDRRGRGDSGDIQPYAVEREIEDIEALINEADESAFVFGMSSGSVLALDAAVHGLAIKKLALYEPPFNIDNVPELDKYPEQITALLSEGRSGDAVALAMKTFGTPAKAIAGMRQTPIWSIFESVAPTLAYDATIMDDGSIPSERIASINIPILVIDGGASPVWLRHLLKRSQMPFPTHEVAL